MSNVYTKDSVEKTDEKGRKKTYTRAQILEYIEAQESMKENVNQNITELLADIAGMDNA